MRIHFVWIGLISCTQINDNNKTDEAVGGAAVAYDSYEEDDDDKTDD